MKPTFNNEFLFFWSHETSQHRKQKLLRQIADLSIRLRSSGVDMWIGDIHRKNRLRTRTRVLHVVIPVYVRGLPTDGPGHTPIIIMYVHTVLAGRKGGEGGREEREGGREGGRERSEYFDVHPRCFLIRVQNLERKLV